MIPEQRIDWALLALRAIIRKRDLPDADEELSFRTLVRDCLLRLCGRIIQADGCITRADLYEWLQDEGGRGEVLLAAMPLELSALRAGAKSSPLTSSVHRDDIRTVCEARNLQTAERETLRALADDAGRYSAQQRALAASARPEGRLTNDELFVDALAAVPEDGVLAGVTTRKVGDRPPAYASNL